MKQLVTLAICLLLILFAAESSRAQKPELIVQSGFSWQIYCVAFSPNGNVLASASQGEIKLADASTGIEIRTLNVGNDLIHFISFGPDSNKLISQSRKNVKLWNVITGQEIRTFASGATMAFSPDGQILVGTERFKNEGDGEDIDRVTLWDAATGVKIRTFSGSSNPYYQQLIFSPNGKYVAGRNSNQIIIWDAQAGKVVQTFDEDPNSMRSSIKAFSFSADSNVIAIASDSGLVKFWSINTEKITQVLAAHSGSVNSVTFSPDGKTLATASSDKTIKLWETATGKVLRSLSGHSDIIKSLAFSPDSRRLASGSNDMTVEIWDLDTGKPSDYFAPYFTEVSSVAFSPDGTKLASASGLVSARDSKVKLWYLTTNQTVQLLRGHSGAISSVAFSPDNRILASGSTDKTVRLWDASSGRDLFTLSGNNHTASSMVFSPDSKLLASGDFTTLDAREDCRGFQTWDTTTGRVNRSFIGHSDCVYAVAFSPDSKVLASGSFDKTIKLWDVVSGKEIRTLVADPFRILSLAFSPSGSVLASGGSSSDSTIKLWDVATGKEITKLAGHTGGVMAIAFSPDGKYLISGGGDNKIIIWEVASGNRLRTLNGHQASVQSISLSLDGNIIASGSYDKTIKLWETHSGRELAALVVARNGDWLVTTPDGLFDGSPAAWNKIIWRFNDNTFNYAPVEAFYGDFYYPGLLSDIFAGKRPKAPSDISQKDRRQPQLKLTLPDAQPNATLTARNVAVKIDVAELAAVKDNQKGSGARDVRLFCNGSLVKVWRGDVLKGKNSVTLEATVPIVAGENKFTAYAFNHDNIKSSDATLTVTGGDSLKRKGTLHILAVGVSQYANHAYNLDYTTDDATSFASQLKLEQEKRTQYQSVEIKTLLNESATKGNILAELKKLATSVQPEDGVVVYFSGHGKADGDRFYLVPHDLGYTGSRDQLSAAGLKAILAHSISDQELEEAFRGIDAGQMFMIIDACNSGQALENKDEPRRGPMNTRGLAQLAYEKGMYIMTASQNVEEAFVSRKLKHSYLTYALVEEGLKTKAADADHNGEVTLREWFDYALARVPKLREETLQSKSLEEVNPTIKAAARNQKSQTPRVFYRREPDVQPMIVARVGVTR